MLANVQGLVKRLSILQAKLDVAMNDIGACGGQALADVIPSSALQSIVVGPKATRIPLALSEVLRQSSRGSETLATIDALCARSLSKSNSQISMRGNRTRFDASSVGAGSQHA
mgnify:CR=1 FL=1